jgi:hypothetical protein
MSGQEWKAADDIRRILINDRRFDAVSGATAYRQVRQGIRGWSDAGFFSFKKDGKLYRVTVERG